jgi:hypothetical protein
VNKSLYKIEVFLLRTIPYILATGYALNTVLSYFDIDLVILSMICSIGVVPYMFILISSFVFKFCKYHRMMIYYIGVTELLSWIDYYHKIPISDNLYFVMLFITLGIFLFLFTYFRIKNK